MSLIDNFLFQVTVVTFVAVTSVICAIYNFINSLFNDGPSETLTIRDVGNKTFELVFVAICLIVSAGSIVYDGIKCIFN